MNCYKLETGLSKEVYKITNKEDFEENIREKEKYIYKNNDGEKYGLAVCPRCDNPVIILGLYKKLKRQKPYAKHHNRSTEIAVIDKNAYLHCPYSDPNFNSRKYDKSKILPLTNFERKLYCCLRDYFDMAIHLLNEELDFYISESFAKQLLEEFVNSYAYRNEMANIHNLPYLLLDNMGNVNLICRLIKKNTELWKYLDSRDDVILEPYNKKYDKLLSKSGFVFLQFHFYSHSISQNAGYDATEKIKFGIIDSPDVEKKRVYTKPYEINEWSFPNLCKQTEYRDQKLLDLARDIMPEI